MRRWRPGRARADAGRRRRSRGAGRRARGSGGEVAVRGGELGARRGDVAAPGAAILLAARDRPAVERQRRAHGVTAGAPAPGDQAPAVQHDALADAGQRPRPRAGGRRRGSRPRAPRRRSAGAPRPAGAADVERGRQRVLNDAVGGDVDAGGQLALVAVDVHGHRQPARAHAAHERLDVAQRRLRRERRIGVLAAQHAEQAPELVQRLAARRSRSPRRRRAASSGRVSASRRAPVACTVIALSACATTSCSSPAMRVRSSATARPAAPARRRSSSSAFSRSAPCSAARLRSRRPISTGAPSETASVNSPPVSGASSSYGHRRREPERGRDRQPGQQVAVTRVAAEPERRDERRRERQQQLVVVHPAQRRQQRDRAERDRHRGQRSAPPVDQRDRHHSQQQCRERAMRRPRRHAEGQLGPELERQRRGDAGLRVAAAHAGKSDVRVPVCPRTRERSLRHP